jgi:endonuclease/exonuclease/phosphatase family metal-dependent hydrolase
MTKLSLNILTFNIGLVPFRRQPYRRIRLFARQIEAMDVDIMNLQEVHTYDFFWHLRRRLAGFPYASYQPSVIGPKAGLVTFSKVPLRRQCFMTLSTHKGLLFSENRDGLVVVNAHLIANKDGDWSQANRHYPLHKAQLSRVKEFLARSDYESRSIILTGDFNVAKNSDLYGYFTEESSWQDTMKDDFTPTFHSEYLPKGRMPQRIDYMFVRGDIEVKNAALMFEKKDGDTYVSDHIGLFATTVSATFRAR